jgi:hypothetical protein
MSCEVLLISRTLRFGIPVPYEIRPLRVASRAVAAVLVLPRHVRDLGVRLDGAAKRTCRDGC